MQNPYHAVSGYPETVSAAGAIARLLDGLGFRLYWATQGLAEADYNFSPGRGCNSLGHILHHIWGLVNWIHLNIYGREACRPTALSDQRDHVLELVWSIRCRIAQLNDAEVARIEIDGHPFWHIINGPIADAISHVGQLNVLRRLLGKAPIDARVFTCEPPLT